MASFTAGYGPRVTISDNGSDKVRITYDGFDFDWELYEDILVDGSHYIYNQTRTASAAITAKGCTSGTAVTRAEQDRAGFYFDVDLTYSTTTWASTDRCVPTFQIAANDYNTAPLAIAAMSVNDILILWFAGLAIRAVLHDLSALSSTNKAVSVYGGLSRQRIKLGGSNGIIYNGDLSAQISQVVVRNAQGANTIVVQYEPSTAGAGISMRRLVGLSFGTAFRIYGAILHDTCELINVVAISGRPTSANYAYLIGNGSGETANTARIKMAYCAAYGYALTATVFRLYGAGLTVTNCWSTGGVKDFHNQAGSSPTLSHCASSDESADDYGGAGHLINQSHDDLALWGHNDNGFYADNVRILQSSSLYQAGTPVAGVDYDIDGNTRHLTTPSIGIHEGTFSAYDMSASAAGLSYTAALVKDWEE